MFGHKRTGRPVPVEELAVDANLEQDIRAVEQAVEAYLREPSEGPRKDLSASLKVLDNQIELGDAYASQFTTSIRFGGSPDEPVVGSTGRTPIVEEITDTAFRAQATLVKAAKEEVTDPTPDTLAALRTAYAALTNPDT